ncbi:BCS1 AAA-TYPE ATPASE [Salix viminalis]|uniref:BCS1 AAA-TYPE ATPASE n=1 Tax=Salix viminalis TaxID=40686 RepID=A0A9Q0NMD6_SALVM|nr:BCS1 AAA-TYPE ATPASE [Salix viminalis]
MQTLLDKRIAVSQQKHNTWQENEDHKWFTTSLEKKNHDCTSNNDRGVGNNGFNHCQFHVHLGYYSAILPVRGSLLLRQVYSKNHEPFSILTLRFQSMSTPEIASREVKPTLLWRHISALTHPSALRDSRQRWRKDCSNLVLSMDEYERVKDEFQGIQVWWVSSMVMPLPQAMYPQQERRYYRLTFHKRYREIIAGALLEACDAARERN